MEQLPQEEMEQLLPALGGEEQQVVGLLEVPLGTCCNFTQTTPLGSRFFRTLFLS